jgi:FAD/FMN-containing dehydrogenase
MRDRLQELGESLHGDVLIEGDREYEGARTSFNLLIDRRPAAIARCIDADDVAAALALAQESDLEIAVRGGGHNPAGHCAVDDGLVVDLTRMRGVEVDPNRRLAVSQGGATWSDFDAATQAHGLVTPGGVVGSTGVTGLTLGGGIGHLTAQHGLTCDNLVAAELVTPAGEVVRADGDENPELLWGLRGGGGNFGVVTRGEFRLHPLERVVGGRFDYEGQEVRGALRAFRDADARAGNEISVQCQIGATEELVPKLVVVPCYTGEGEDTEELRALRAAPGLVNDAVRTQGFLDQQLVFDPGYGVDRNYWKGHFVRELPDELIDILVDSMGALGRRPGAILIESLRGAPKDVDPASAALGAVSGGYANYMQADEPLERVRAAFGPESFDRLRALKKRYDPNNVLHRNQNIPPAD